MEKGYINNMRKTFFLIISLFLFFSIQNCFGQTSTSNTTPEQYKDEEFPQAMKDLRRFEIITLGAMPFITLDSAIAYNGYKFVTGKSSTFNPLATADYSQDEMERIIITSICISAGVGLSDYIINLIKRNRIKKQQKLENTTISIEENPDAIRIPLPQETQNQSGDFE